jgi:hypothetical protein
MSSAPRDASVRLGWLLAALPILACACSSSASAPGETADAADVTADVAGGDGSRADTATALEGGADVATDAPTAEVADAATASPFPLVDPPPGFAGLAPSAPLTLTAATGKTLSNLSITNPNGPCIAIHGGADLVLDHVSLGPCKGDGVSIDGHATRVTIRNSYVHDTTGNGVGTYQASGVTLTGSHFARISSGGYFAESTGVIVERCSVLNVQGPFPRGQLAQFNGVTGPSNAIRCNVMENRAGESNPEDGINLYVSSGTAASPIVVEGNRIRGGGPSTSGGGILLGDGGKTSAYQISRFNVLADPGQYGTAVSGGSHMTIEGNVVYARQQSFTNVGIYAWDQYASSCTDVTVKNNRVDWTSKDGTKNPWWNGGNCTATTESGDVFDATLGPSIVDVLPDPCR